MWARCVRRLGAIISLQQQTRGTLIFAQAHRCTHPSITYIMISGCRALLLKYTWAATTAPLMHHTIAMEMQVNRRRTTLWCKSEMADPMPKKRSPTMEWPVLWGRCRRCVSLAGRCRLASHAPACLGWVPRTCDDTITSFLLSECLGAHAHIAHKMLPFFHTHLIPQPRLSAAWLKIQHVEN